MEDEENQGEGEEEHDPFADGAWGDEDQEDASEVLGGLAGPAMGWLGSGGRGLASKGKGRGRGRGAGSPSPPRVHFRNPVAASAATLNPDMMANLSALASMAPMLAEVCKAYAKGGGRSPWKGRAKRRTRGPGRDGRSRSQSGDEGDEEEED
jgi:hypothetical protein